MVEKIPLASGGRGVRFRPGPMKSPWIIASLLTLLPVPWAAALPPEVTVTAPARLELLNQGKPAGSVALRVGETLAVVDTAGEHVLVRYRNLNGRVLAAHTNLPREGEPVVVAAPPPAPVVPAPAPPVAALPALAPVAAPSAVARSEYVPGGAIARSLAGKLVALQGGGLRPWEPARLAGVKFFGIYFSAGWCGPCRRFTPELIDAYGKIRALYPEFEVILVNRDKSPADMAAYVREDKMPWPALEWSAAASTREIMRYAGSGIPCLVLVDAEGKVLSDSYRWGRYVGPDAVLEDTWKVLRDYRRKNPRPRT
jgi:nucleoredoxin